MGADFSIVNDSDRLTSGKTRQLTKIIKRWKMLHSNIAMRSHEIEGYVAEYYDNHYKLGEEWSLTVSKFFTWLSLQSGVKTDASYIDTARRQANKAYKWQMEGDEHEAQNEWFKVFGRAFPACSASKNTIFKLTNQWPSEDEQFIENMFPVKINSEISVSINATVSKKGFMSRSLQDFLSRYNNQIPSGATIKFSVDTDAEGDVSYF